MSRITPFVVKNKAVFLKKLLYWSDTKSSFCFMGNIDENHSLPYYNGFPFVSFIGIDREIKYNTYNDDGFVLVNDFIKDATDNIVGFLSYDMKNQIENLNSTNHDGIEMPLFHFFKPEYIFTFSNSNEVNVVNSSKSEQDVIDLSRTIEKCVLGSSVKIDNTLNLLCRVSKDEYIKSVKKIKEHIQLGDVYELNYCIEFFAEEVEINPIDVYIKLNKISSAPFSCFYKVDNKYLICASPERFLKKDGNNIIAQPMKGTARRSADSNEDEFIKEELFTNEKERAENVMIVDLVRNDLSKTAVKKSVKVDELFGVYSFPQVHQMVSTVSSEMRDDVSVVDVIKSSFPMGSMTGAPKVKAMELIEEFEITKRGLFSGAVGYITNDKNFDFNVVIRSIQYNADKKYLSFMVGSAITINSDPEKEYEECLLKAQALIEALK